MRRLPYLLSITVLCVIPFSCSKDCFHHTPKASFTYIILNPGTLPAKVNFTSTSSNATSYEWQFGDGTKFQIVQDTISHLYATPGIYSVQLVAIGKWGKDTVVQDVPITAKQ